MEVKIYNDEVQKHITHTIRGKVAFALGDGHCLRRSIGKTEFMSPGEVVQQLQRKCLEMIKERKVMQIESDIGWYLGIAYPNPAWLQLQTSVQNHTDVYAGNNELQLWAIIAKKPMISLNAYTGVATLYKPDLRHLPTTHNDLAQLHNNLMDEYGKLPGYVPYNNINHYNAIIQLDALTTGETPAEIPRIDQGKEHKRANITPDAGTDEEKDMLTLDVSSETKRTATAKPEDTRKKKKQKQNTNSQCKTRNIITHCTF